MNKKDEMKKILQFDPLVNSDLKSIRTLANSDPIFKKALVNSDLVYGVRIDKWSRSELTKVRVDQGPN